LSSNILGAQVVCQGQNGLAYSISNATNNPTSYVWTLPSSYLGVSQSSQIVINFALNALPGTLSVVAVNNCGTSNIVSQNILVNPKPIKPTISNNGNSIISSSLNGNQWYDINGIINGANTTVYVGASNNSYYVVVTEQGCISDPSNIIALSSSGVVELLSNTIKIYPNPFSELINIEVSHKDHLEYLLTTVDGKVISKGIFMGLYKIDTKKLSSGTYFLIINDKDKSKSYKIIKH
jgi:hypothetical protein